MGMIWYNQNLSKLEITISDFGFNLSKGAYNCINSKDISIGIDKENKVIVDFV